MIPQLRHVANAPPIISLFVLTAKSWAPMRVFRDGQAIRFGLRLVFSTRAMIVRLH